MRTEEIYLSSPEAREQDVESWASRGTLVTLQQQHRHVPGMQRLSLVEGNLLKLERRHRRSALCVYIDLGIVDPVPERERHVPLWCIATVLFSAIGVGLLIWLDSLPVPLTDLQFAGALAAVVGIGFGAGWLGVLRFRRMTVFLSRHGRIPLLRLVEKQPNAVEFRRFLESLCAAAGAAEDRMPADRQRYLALELQEHRRLADACAMGPDAYETAKARILSRH
ncbi:MAG: hypothetical protein WED00_15675 [Aquisalimonadaceae bacterium]